MMSGPKVPENLPDEIRAVAQSLVETTDAFLALRGETISFRRSAQQVRDSGSLPDVPTVVITRGKRVWPDNEQGDRLESIWRNLAEGSRSCRAWTSGLGGNVPGLGESATIVIAEHNSGHAPTTARVTAGAS